MKYLLILWFISMPLFSDSMMASVMEATSRAHIKTYCNEKAKILIYNSSDEFWKQFSVNQIYSVCINNSRPSPTRTPGESELRKLMEEISDGLITKRAKQVGFNHCITAVRSLEKFLTKNKTYAVNTMTSTVDVNTNILNTTVEITYTDISELVNLSIIPNSNGTCSYSYTVTWHTKQSCKDYSKKSLSNFSSNGNLNKNVNIFSKDTLTFYLLNSKQGCTVQKHEMSYGAYKKDK